LTKIFRAPNPKFVIPERIKKAKITQHVENSRTDRTKKETVKALVQLFTYIN
jgi:hypothetical protein